MQFKNKITYIIVNTIFIEVLMKKDVILLTMAILVIAQVIYHWHGLHGNHTFQIIGIIYVAGTVMYLITKRLIIRKNNEHRGDNYVK